MSGDVAAPRAMRKGQSESDPWVYHDHGLLRVARLGKRGTSRYLWCQSGIAKDPPCSCPDLP